jgi:hypothetical protein
MASRGSSGSTAKPAASSTERPSVACDSEPRAPKQAHGAPARPETSAVAWATANSVISAAAPHAAPSTPAPTPTASASSTAISAAQARPAASPRRP